MAQRSEESFDSGVGKDLPNKISALSSIPKSLEMKYRGFRFDNGQGKWIICGEALGGAVLINALVGIVSTFTEDVNLLTTKDMDKFSVEFSDAFFKGNGMILNAVETPAENYRPIIKMFKDSMSNTGDIITGSKKAFEKIIENHTPPVQGETY